MLPYLRFRLQRSMRRLRRDIRLWNLWLQSYLDLHVWGKWRQLGIIRRFVVVWWLLILIMVFGTFSQISGLSSFYLTPGPRAGGSYIEGIVGSVKTLNPILPENSAASDVNRLVFSGLTRYTPKRTIEGDLASSWKVSDDGKTYTFSLRKGVTWHDGQPFTSQDVLYTIATIQNPDTRSPLNSSWQGIRVEAKDEHTVIFTLPNAYAPFVYSTTVGIVPSHLLGGVDPGQLRVNDFNQRPVGTGPFRVTRFVPADREVLLAANPRYYLGKPLLDQVTVRLFDNTEEAGKAYVKRQLTAIANAGSLDFTKLGLIKQYHLNLPEEAVLFWRTGSGLLADKTMREAFSAAIDREAIIRDALGGQGVSLGLPLLPGQVGFSTKSRPTSFNISQAERLLDKAGWQKKESSKFRQKDGKDLSISLVTGKSGDYPRAAAIIQEQLARVGVEVKVATADSSTLQQTYIRPRNYDALLYGINIGADPDVYVYWHSSQVSDPGLNLSQYKSPAADRALEGARLTNDNAVRASRYASFLAAWTADVPAVVLYEPDYLYAVTPSAKGITAHKLIEPNDRFYGIERWTVQTQDKERY